MKEVKFTFEQYFKNFFSNIEIISNSYIECINSNENEYEKEKKLEKNSIYLDIILEKDNYEYKNENFEFITFEYIKKIYDLDGINWLCFCISFMSRYSKSYKEIFKRIDNDIVNCAIKLYFFKLNLYKIKNFYQMFNEVKNKMNILCFDENFEFDKKLFELIIYGFKFNFNENGKDVIFPKKNKNKILRKEIFEKILFILKNSKNKLYFFLKGEKGLGKKFLVKSLMNKIDSCLILIDLEEVILNYKNINSFLKTTFRESLILRAFFCFYNCEILNYKKYYRESRCIFRMLDYFDNHVFFLSSKNIECNLFKEKFSINFYLNKLNTDQNIQLWEDLLKKNNICDIDSYEISSIFNFNPKQVDLLLKKFNKINFLNCKTSKKELISFLNDNIDYEFNENAIKIVTNYNWDDLIINKEEKDIIMEACSRIRYKNLVFNMWGMEKIFFYGKGVSLLFSGQSGTGKTMAASVIANELGLNLYRVDISQLISKYIGETEKNINKIFNKAEKANIILLFDEVDAIMGKRCETKDSHDRNANIEISFLLQKIEEYEGMCIMTTNFLENIDKAFFRRINYVIHFSLPNFEERIKIWTGMFKNSPLSQDIDFDFISKFEISGGSIKNSALSAAFLAISDEKLKKKKIHMKHILKSIKYELKKQGRSIQKNEFGKYSHII